MKSRFKYKYRAPGNGRIFQKANSAAPMWTITVTPAGEDRYSPWHRTSWGITRADERKMLACGNALADYMLSCTERDCEWETVIPDFMSCADERCYDVAAEFGIPVAYYDMLHNKRFPNVLLVALPPAKARVYYELHSEDLEIDEPTDRLFVLSEDRYMVRRILMGSSPLHHSMYLTPKRRAVYIHGFHACEQWLVGLEAARAHIF